MRAPLVLAVALLAALPVAGCSSSAGSKPAAAKTPAPAATAPADVAGATAQVKADWAGFFDASKPAAQRAALVQGGAQLAQAMAIAARSPGANATKAVVTSVTFSAPDKAAVTYNLLIAGKPVLTGAQGQAVLDQGVWKVSTFTFCQLVKLGAGSTPVPGCA